MDLKENCTYVMHNFKVLKNNGQYRVCDHQFKLVFIGVAVVRQCVLNDLPFRKYKFAGFADVVAGQFEPGLLVDVIDVVDEVVFRHVSRKGRRVVFKLKDLRYRLEVMINHRDENTKFLLWDRECTELIGQSVDTVNRLKNEDGDVDLNASPQALDKLLGYVLAFKIKVQPKFRKFAILKCSTDSSLIDVVMDMLPNAETSSKINVPTFDSNHSTEHEPVNFNHDLHPLI
ncbi:hypothetical protein GYH30_049690 [Glycine max]|uniref:DUF223 domain-containing protein n=1 Tax=Glycine max TaxID=3847 RepID=A0A0R0F8M7_SOYBN|nr:hypothetical protein GYH30_049690 [Glycine max]